MHRRAFARGLRRPHRSRDQSQRARDQLPMLAGTWAGIINLRDKRATIQGDNIERTIANASIVCSGHFQRTLRPQAGERLVEFVPEIVGQSTNYFAEHAAHELALLAEPLAQATFNPIAPPSATFLKCRPCGCRIDRRVVHTHARNIIAAQTRRRGRRRPARQPLSNLHRAPPAVASLARRATAFRNVLPQRRSSPVRCELVHREQRAEP